MPMYNISFTKSIRSLGVNQSVRGNFTSVLFNQYTHFLFLSWFGGLSVKNKNVLMRVVNVCGREVGERQVSMSRLYERRMARKARVTARDPSHTLARKDFAQYHWVNITGSSLLVVGLECPRCPRLELPEVWYRNQNLV